MPFTHFLSYNHLNNNLPNKNHITSYLKNNLLLNDYYFDYINYFIIISIILFIGDLKFLY